jgi:hypothetical protein
MEENIIFSYIGCSREDFSKEVSYDEAVFSEKLASIYKLHIQVDRIEITIHHDKGAADEPFGVTIDVVAPEVAENKVVEHGKDLAGTTRTAVDKVIQLFRKHKDKQVHK